MANVIDIVLRSHDQATAGIGRVSSEVKGMGSGLDGLAGKFNLVTLAVGALAVGAGALFRVAQSAANEAETLERTAKNAGVASENMEVLARVLKNAGLAGEEFNRPLAFLNRQIATANPLLAAMGVNARDTWTAFLQLADRLSEVNDVGVRTEVMTRLLGRGSMDLVGIMPGLSGEIARVRGQMIAWGAVMDPGLKRSLAGVDQDMDNLATRWQGMTRDIQRATVTVYEFIRAEMKRKDEFERASETWNSLTGRRSMNFPMADVGRNLGDSRLLAAHGAIGGAPEPDWLKKVNALLQETEKSAKKAHASIADLARAAYMEDRTKAPAAGSLFTALLGKNEPVATRGTPGYQDLVAQWRYEAGEMGRIAEDAARSVAYAFEGVFVGLLSRSQTFASAMKSIFESLAASILASLARILARIGLTALGTAIGGPVGGLIGSVASGLSANAPRGGDTYVINAMDARSVVGQLQSPYGSLKRAGDQVRYGMAY